MFLYKEVRKDGYIEYEIGAYIEISGKHPHGIYAKWKAYKTEYTQKEAVQTVKDWNQLS